MIRRLDGSCKYIACPAFECWTTQARAKAVMALNPILCCSTELGLQRMNPCFQIFKILTMKFGARTQLCVSPHHGLVSNGRSAKAQDKRVAVDRGEWEGANADARIGIEF
jgi:hypothetical protein